ncbi:hypothetical protein FKR81_27940 [Lentzea tibetensis]|uniref:Glycosyl transferase family 3 domain-containing protein n=1 Tax=Lentzea tibetensis TaxID=2591470 RepID=A0A563EMT4_9PSEU|nr:hypothetical protein FKR81_27940 [Lentzea tibetensis]
MDAVVNRRRPVEPGMCREFWDRLGDRQVDAAEAAALLAALSARMPDPAAVATLVESLLERRPRHGHRFPGAVNVVGTGGGPSTANISTAAAFVAAAAGVPVVKTGSRASSGGVGSINLLDRLGVSLTRSYERTGEHLARFGIAFAGYFVYPVELTRLARTVLPLDMRTIGRWVNTIGPFLADVPVSAQLTGVSDVAHLPALRRLADGRRIWLCTNDLGADELVSVAVNTVHGDSTFTVDPRELGIDGGSLDDLRGPSDDAEVVTHFLDLLAGRASSTAVATVCLNAAALAVAGGHQPNLTSGLRAAFSAVADGAARALAERVMSRG